MSACDDSSIDYRTLGSYLSLEIKSVEAKVLEKVVLETLPVVTPVSPGPICAPQITRPADIAAFLDHEATQPTNRFPQTAEQKRPTILPCMTITPKRRPWMLRLFSKSPAPLVMSKQTQEYFYQLTEEYRTLDESSWPYICSPEVWICVDCVVACVAHSCLHSSHTPRRPLSLPSIQTCILNVITIRENRTITDRVALPLLPRVELSGHTTYLMKPISKVDLVCG